MAIPTRRKKLQQTIGRNRRQDGEESCSGRCWRKPLILGFLVFVAVLGLSARFFQWETRFLQGRQQQEDGGESTLALLQTKVLQQSDKHEEGDNLSVSSQAGEEEPQEPVEEDPTVMNIFPPDLRPLDPQNNPRDKCLLSIRKRHEQSLRPHLQNVDHILYLDPSYHENFGDTMLTMGVLKFLQKGYYTSSSKRRIRPKITQCHYAQTSGYVGLNCDDAISKLEKEYQNRTVLAVWHAGGNWGDLYPHVHRARINSFAKILQAGFKVLAMPSSYHYKQYHMEWRQRDKIRENILNNTQPGHSSQERVIFTWREQYSYEKAIKEYPFATNLLVPDIAFQLGPYDMEEIHKSTPTTKRDDLYDLLVFLRTDRESLVDQTTIQSLIDKITGGGDGSSGGGIKYLGPVDWPARYKLFGSTDSLDMKTAVQLMGIGKVIVADRLHASILSYLCDKPLVYVDQMTGKINKTLSVALNSEGCSSDLKQQQLDVSQGVDITNAIIQVLDILKNKKK